MSRPLWQLGGIGAFLGLLIVGELTRMEPAAETGMNATPPASRPAVSAAAPRDHSADWSATLLARPLFSPERRPPAAAPAGRAVRGEPPRLAGIIISPSGRTAIFAPVGARPVAAREGDTVEGSWTVKQIASNKVRLTGPDSERVLTLSFDNGGVVPSGPSADPRAEADNADRSRAGAGTLEGVPRISAIFKLLQQGRE